MAWGDKGSWCITVGKCDVVDKISDTTSAILFAAVWPMFSRKMPVSNRWNISLPYDRRESSEARNVVSTNRFHHHSRYARKDAKPSRSDLSDSILLGRKEKLETSHKRLSKIVLGALIAPAMSTLHSNSSYHCHRIGVQIHPKLGIY